jgi:hypothetical protein
VALSRRFRRPGAIGIALTAWELWWRIPPQQRNALLKQAAKVGSKAAAQLRAKRKPPPR